MKRLFRRPQESSKSSRLDDSCNAPRSDADLKFSSYELEQIGIHELDEPVQKQEQREARRLHHRAWSMESDFRISRGGHFEVMRVSQTDLSSTVILSPLLALEEETKEVAEACCIPTTASFTSLAGSIARLAPSQSFLSTTSMREYHDDASMPSWPSSILCRPEGLSPAPSTSNQPGAEDDIVNHVTPTSGRLTMKLTPTSVRSPLNIDSAVQVDEFGRIIMTVNADHQVSLGRQVRFKDTFTVVSNRVHFSPTVSIESADTNATKASRDTFGIDVDKCHIEDTMSYSSDGATGDSSLAFDLQPGTPFLLKSTPLISHNDDISDDEKPLPTIPPVFCFPALCQAATSMSSLQDQVSQLHSSAIVINSALLPPIELFNEQAKPLNFVEAPKAYNDEKLFAPWRSSQQVGLPTSNSDGKLLNYESKMAMTGRARAESNVDFTKGWDHKSTHAQASLLISFPNPHTSIDLSKNQDGVYFSPLSVLASPSDGATIASTQESNASVRSIIDQQRIAMNKLAKAGFWQQNNIEKEESDRERVVHYRLPSLPQEELISKVSQWAWLLSSEADKGRGDEDMLINRPSSRPSSPTDGQSIENQRSAQFDQEEPTTSKKSWEWLVSEDDFIEDSFESNETVQDVTMLQVTGLGLQQDLPLNQGVEETYNQERSCDSTVERITQNDSFTVDTPELGQRESRTTAAIEALLTQIQRSQDPASTIPESTVVRKLGTSYLYHQILKNIAEEEDRVEEGK